MARLFEFADADLDALVLSNRGSRRRRRDEWRVGDANPYRGFQDVLTFIYETGCRPIEAASVTVGDFQRRARTVVLGRHKTRRTRTITLSDAAWGHLDRLCRGRAPVEPIFIRTNVGKPWRSLDITRRFEKVRRLAKVREKVTAYSIRHMHIPKMLMAGADIALVARMSGNSVAVIEKVYAHFRTDYFKDALARLAEFRGSGGNSDPSPATGPRTW